MLKARFFHVAALMAFASLPFCAAQAQDRSESDLAIVVLDDWYRLTLELVRHTATYSPPVASRAFGYVGVAGYEAVASGSDTMQSLAGQLNGLTEIAPRDAAQDYDTAVVLQAALAASMHALFANTGPTGQRAMAAMEAQLAAKVAEGLDPLEVTRSQQYGVLVAGHILDWASTDGGANVENLGFPLEYTLADGPADWRPTSLIALQQFPLLPNWGTVRPFIAPSAAGCALPGPPEYSVDPNSQFYREAVEVLEVTAALSDDQKLIARFWSDDPMLSPTPPGHWISIAMAIMDRNQTGLESRLDVMARLGIGVADAFIGCWQEKYRFNLLRPISYIRKNIDPDWNTLLITPPFPEYPSGHSTQSGAAAAILTDLFGENFAFEDPTHVDDGMAARKFDSFWDAAEEAGISRLYGGIHFRAAIEDGLDQGRCIAAGVISLKTLR